MHTSHKSSSNMTRWRGKWLKFIYLSFVVDNPIFHRFDDSIFTFILRCSGGRCGGGCTSRIGSGPASGASVTSENWISVQRVSGETNEVHLVAVFVVTFVDYIVTIRDRIWIRAVISTHLTQHKCSPVKQ